MPTLIYNTGFEHGVHSAGVSASLVSPQTGLFSSAGSSFSIAAGAARSGSYGLRLAPSGTGGGLQSVTTSTVSTGLISVGRFYFRVASSPTPAGGYIPFLALYEPTGAQYITSFQYDTDTQTISVRRGVGAANYVPGVAINLDQWYRIDFWVDCNVANAWKMKWQIDGVTQANPNADTANYSSVSPVPASQFQLRYGSYYGNALTCQIDIDDVAFSGTFADYPLGAGYSAAILPSSLTLHSTGVFVQDASATVITTGDWARLDDAPIGETTDYIRQTTGSAAPTTGHPQVGFSNTVTDVINGVRAISQYGAAATGANASRQWVTANAVDTYLHGAAATQPTIGALGPVYATNQVSNGLIAWTDDHLDGLLIRFGTGGGTDVNPVPRYDAFMLEVDYVETPPPPFVARRPLVIPQSVRRASVR